MLSICRLTFPNDQEILEEYNETNTPMNLVLFDDALEHLTRVHRIIRMDRGHALLVGAGGSGKQSLARLAAFTAGCEVSLGLPPGTPAARPCGRLCPALSHAWLWCPVSARFT